MCPNRAANVTFTVQDGCGNAATSSASFVVVERAPELTAEASDVTIESDGDGNQKELQFWLDGHGWFECFIAD